MLCTAKRLFTREDIKKKYKETNRWTINNHSKSFASYIHYLLQKKYITEVNSGIYQLENEGLTLAKSIILDDSKHSSQKKKRVSPYTMTVLTLSEEQRRAVKKYWNSYHCTSNMDKAVLAAYWLKTEKGIEEITANLFFTILCIVGEEANFDLSAAIKNAKRNKNFFISGKKPGSFTLSYIGEAYIKTLAITKNGE